MVMRTTSSHRLHGLLPCLVSKESNRNMTLISTRVDLLPTITDDLTRNRAQQEETMYFLVRVTPSLILDTRSIRSLDLAQLCGTTLSLLPSRPMTSLVFRLHRDRQSFPQMTIYCRAPLTTLPRMMLPPLVNYCYHYHSAITSSVPHLCCGHPCSRYHTPPFYDSHDTHLRSPKEERVARDEFTPQLDSDSSSVTSVSTTSGWVDPEPSPVGAFVTPHDDLPPFPTVDNPDGPFLFDLASDANVEFTGGKPLVEGMRSSLKTRGAVTAHYKRKRLFLIDEDEYGERACKQRCIEQ
jgi:hypothetical protein